MSTDIPVTIEPPRPSEALLPGRVMGGVWRRLFHSSGRISTWDCWGDCRGRSSIPWWGWVRWRGSGLCIALCYLGLFDSLVGNGQTIGKRFLRLKVVDAHKAACFLLKKPPAFHHLRRRFFRQRIAVADLPHPMGCFSPPRHCGFRRRKSRTLRLRSWDWIPLEAKSIRRLRRMNRRSRVE